MTTLDFNVVVVLSLYQLENQNVIACDRKGDAFIYRLISQARLGGDYGGQSFFVINENNKNK